MNGYLGFYFSKTFLEIDVPASLSKKSDWRIHRSSSFLNATGAGLSSHFLPSGQASLSAFLLLWNSSL